jgi:hypothetical protein
MPELETIDHPTLGPLKFPTDMGPDERNESIQRAMMDKARNPAASIQRPNPIASATDVYLPDNASNPGVSDGAGLREGLGEYVERSGGDVVRGVGDIAHGNIAKGTHKIMSGWMNAAAPALPFVAAGAPLAVARAGAGGYVGSKLARSGSEALGASPDQADVASDIGGIAGGYGAGEPLNRIARPVLSRVTPKQVGQAVGGTGGAVAGHGTLSAPGVYYGARTGGKIIEGVLGKARAGAPIMRPVEPPPGVLHGPESPPRELLQGRVLTEGGRIPPEPAAGLGKIPVREMPAESIAKPSTVKIGKPGTRLVLSPEEAQSADQIQRIATTRASQRGMQYAGGMRPPGRKIPTE